MTPERWLLLRGLGREAEHWHDVPQALERAFGLSPGSVLCLDLPGTGTETHRSSPWTLGRTLEDIRQRWHEARSDDGAPWGLVGISLGGMLVLEWTHRHPQDVAAVVAINPSDRRSGLWIERLRWQALPLMLRIAITRDLTRREELVLRLTTGVLAGARRKAILDERIAMARRNPTRAASVVRQLVAAAFWTAPTRVAVPGLVVGADGDRMVSPLCPIRLARNLDLPFTSHPKGGHDLPVDDPEWVCGRIVEWMNS
jgi:pimeloyl-ACP methyl ester carboxylesterase